MEYTISVSAYIQRNIKLTKVMLFLDACVSGTESTVL